MSSRELIESRSWLEKPLSKIIRPKSSWRKPMLRPSTSLTLLLAVSPAPAIPAQWVGCHANGTPYHYWGYGRQHCPERIGDIPRKPFARPAHNIMSRPGPVDRAGAPRKLADPRNIESVLELLVFTTPTRLDFRWLIPPE